MRGVLLLLGAGLLAGVWGAEQVYEGPPPAQVYEEKPAPVSAYQEPQVYEDVQDEVKELVKAPKVKEAISVDDWVRPGSLPAPLQGYSAPQAPAQQAHAPYSGFPVGYGGGPDAGLGAGRGYALPGYGFTGSMGFYYQRLPTAYKWMTSQSDTQMFLKMARKAGEFTIFKKKDTTYFVPSDTAFTSLTSKELEAVGRSPHILRQLVRYTVLRGARHTPADFEGYHVLPSAQGEMLNFYINRAYGDRKFGAAITVNDARVTRNARVYNGHVYVIDRLLIPDSIHKSLFESY